MKLLKFLLLKYGLIYAALFTVGISIFVSVFITAMAMIWLKMPNMSFAIILSIICPLVIAPPVSYYWLLLIEEANKNNKELQEAHQKLELALKEVKELSGLLPICASCKNIRDDKGWIQIESYIQKHSKVEFSHSICPDCVKELYPELKSNNHEVIGLTNP